VSNIQDIITEAYSKAPLGEKETSTGNTGSRSHGSANDILQTETNFNSLFSTIVWFLEQDPYTNVAFNLDVNF